MTDLGLAGKRVIVTGAAGGLGRAFALAFAKSGATVLVCRLVGVAGAGGGEGGGGAGGGRWA